jgi:hypothetical protein
MNKDRNISGIIFGAVLIIIGILALFGRYIILPDMDNLWPLILVVVGVALFIPLLLGDKSRGGLAVPGSILITIGVILYIMNRTDSWSAWSYCWALIMCAVGAGTWINGYRSEKPELRKRGLDLMRTGLILFIVFGVIMEFIFSTSGEAHWGGLLLWAVLLILVGIYLLVTRLLQVRKPGNEKLNLFWPVLMIGVGLVAALSHRGGLSGDALGRLFNLWPLLLVAAGLGIIFRDRSPWVGLILGVVIVAGIFIVVFAGAQLGLASGNSWFSNIGPIQFGNGSNRSLSASGNQVTQNRQVSGITRVELAANGNLEIRQGQSESLVVTGDEAILPALLTNVSLGQMTIRYDPRYNIRNNAPVKMVLTVKDLNELKLSSSGTVKVGPLTTRNFSLILSSSCNVTVQGLQADKVTTRITSSGDIVMQGTAGTLNLDVSSSVNFQAGDLKVQNANLRISSSADVTLWVVKDLQANISSSSNIAYYGNPVVHQNSNSPARLISRGNK